MIGSHFEPDPAQRRSQRSVTVIWMSDAICQPLKEMANGKWKMANGNASASHLQFSIFHFPSFLMTHRRKQCVDAFIGVVRSRGGVGSDEGHVAAVAPPDHDLDLHA